MKTIYLSILLSVLLFPIAVFGQKVGDTVGLPIEVGTFSAGFNYTNTQNTTDFINNFGRPTNDVYYRFTLTTRMQITMQHCGSTVADTYMYLLDGPGIHTIISNDDDYSGTCSTKTQSYLRTTLAAGTYYVVSEGYSANGYILTQISGVVVPEPPKGDTQQSAINVGTFNKDFFYSDTLDISNNTNQHTVRPNKDVFYKFALTQKMHVTLTHCNSELLDTYMHLLDASGNIITSNDNYSGSERCSSSTLSAFIQRVLNPGTYYVVSEPGGTLTSGKITTNIIGNIPDDFGYPDTPSAYSTDKESVGGLGGSLNISPTGGATYSIPIKVPQGVGGMQPSLAIVYNSQTGNGMAGWGTNLSGISAITRGPKTIYHDGTAKGMTYLADEAYYLDGKRLIYSSGTAGEEGAVYYPESDPFTKIIVHGVSTSANTWFEVQSSTGQTVYYGNTNSARHTYFTGTAQRIYAWYMDYVEDPLGNYMNYTYSQSNLCMYPAGITYGNNKKASNSLQNTVTFSYEARSNDPQPFVIEGVKGSMDRRLKTITSITGNTVYRTYELTYSTTGDVSQTKFSRLTSVTEKNAVGEVLKPVALNWTYLPGMNNAPVTPTIDMSRVSPSITPADQKYTSGDFNRDGLDDIVGIGTASVPGTGGSGISNFAYVYLASASAGTNTTFTFNASYDVGPDFSAGDWARSRTGSSVVDINGDGLNELIIPSVEISPNFKRLVIKSYGNTYSKLDCVYYLQRSSEMPVYTIGDFDNDGKAEIFFIEKGHSSNKYPGEIVKYTTGTSVSHTPFSFTLPSKPEKMYTSDFNGDGLADIMVIYSGGYTIFWNQGNGITETTFSDAQTKTGTNVSSVFMIRPGDFNGDGLMDLLMNATNDTKWYFALNNGNGTFTKLEACTLGVYDQSTDKDQDKFDCNIYDFDFDGKSDVVITKAMYNGDNYSKTYTYWMRSTGTTLTQVRSATSNVEKDGLSFRYMVGDFNGDGQAELMNYGYNCYSSSSAIGDPVWRMYCNSSFNAASGKVTSVTGDYGGTTNITYASLVSDGIYTKGSGALYPVADYTPPLHAVKSVVASNGAAGNMTANYKYSGLKVHLQGKGLLGMSSMTATNSTMGTALESGIKTWNTTFYIPSATYTKQTLDGSTAESNVTLTIVDKGAKKYFAYPNTTTEKDLDGNTVTTTRQFNTTYGYITEEKAVYDNNSAMYRTIQYGNYILAGKVYRPQLITKIQKHADDTLEFTQKTQIAYNTTYGYQAKVIEYYGSSLPLTTDYTYDPWGNVKTKKISGSGVTDFTELYDYDATKRFVSKAYTSPVSSVNSYTYDTWGNVVTETDETVTSNRLTATYMYDGWGNRTQAFFNDGRRETYRNGWGDHEGKRFFTLTQGVGRPWIKTWYDNQGREVEVESIGAKDVSIVKPTVYDSRGQVNAKGVQTGDVTTASLYFFDDRGRVFNQLNTPEQLISYAYGNRTVSSTTNGRITTKVYDTWGGIKSVTDPVSSVTYLYSSTGNPKEINTGGTKFSMTYYPGIGNQETLTDPNAGTITYTYDAAGRVKTQKDGRGKTTTNFYDRLGRLAKSELDGVTTSYTYGTSTNDTLRLIKEQTGNNSISYTYDNLGRILLETRQIEGSGSLTFGYFYNDKGQLSGIGYPGGITIYRTYDSYGNLLQIKEGLGNTQPIWELTDATGTVTTAKLGGTLTSTQTLSSMGVLTNLKTMKSTSTLYNMDYEFNGTTGNLTSRTGMVGTQKESFFYDDADRLDDVKQGSSTVMDINYHANGNISSKTGLGTYSYDSDRPHAVETVDNTGGLISQNDQNITYTAFNKVASVSEKVGADNYLLNITYGPDRQRWKSVLKKNNAIVRTIVYADDYETVTEGGITKNLYYISGDDGLAAVYVKQAGQPDKIYYAHKDHLGSIVALTDNTGAEVFRASYDAWGKRTVANSAFKFHRGYTRHEHLDEFNLIDMNGRMYDPILARFLSPDPFVQMSDLSQNFNRYTYALNNPLKYTDPSGEFFWLIPNIGWSKSGGLNIGFTFMIGIPGVASAQAGIGYSIKSNDLNASVGATAAFNTAYASYSTQGGFSVGWSAGISPQMGFPISTNFTSVGGNYNITHNSLSGNVSAWGIDKNGVTFNPSVSMMIYSEHATNLVRGQGFRNNTNVLRRFVTNGEYQKALDYFGFEGTYDPNINNPGQFTPRDGLIKYNEVAFSKNYDYLRAIYEEELFHSKDYLYAKENTPKDVFYPEYEEWRAQRHMYKNQGLYSNSGFNWVSRTQAWGIRAEIYHQYNLPFQPKWWHFIYKIPRKW